MIYFTHLPTGLSLEPIRMLEAVFFYIFGGIMLAAALLVVFGRSPVYSVLSLLVAMFCLAALFVMLGAYFVAALQILLYAGAVLVLFLFAMMLLNLNQDAALEVRSFARRGVGIIVAGLVGVQLAWLVAKTSSQEISPSALPADGTVAQIGELLFTTYLLPFELTSFLILAAIIAAVTLAKSDKS